MEQRTRKKRKLGSYPFVSVVFSMTLSLLVIGMFGLLLIQAKSLTRAIQSNVELQVYLNKNLSDTEITKLIRLMGAKAYALEDAEGGAIHLITKEEAAAQFVEETGEEFMEFLGDNPLRDALVVKISPDFQTNAALADVKAEIEGMSGVFEVTYVASLVDSINENLTKIGIVLLSFFLILLIAVIILINNTIKLALFSQRFLIRSMQLVGATASFIRRPFISRSVLYGGFAGVLASVLLFVGLNSLYAKVEELRDLLDLQSILILFGVLLVLGMLVGLLSTFFAVRKYLKMSLDELY